MKRVLIALLLVGIFGKTNAAGIDSALAALQDSLSIVRDQVEGLNESYLETKGTVDKSSKLKVSGYIQAQWQLADSAGVPSVAGGNFPFSVVNWHTPTATVVDSARYLDTLASRQRFLIRRARIKTTYDAGTSKYVLEIDVLPTGVSVKDANVTLIEPWLNTFSATLGIMDRPFGFEVPYSSSSMETPERTRMAQILFPGEKDLGAKIEINPSEDMGFLQYLNLKGGVFTGTGGSTPSFTETDGHLDFIGRAGFRIPFLEQNIEIDGGASAYLGKVADRSDFAIETKPGSKTVKIIGDSVVISDTLSVISGSEGKLFDHNLYGVDAELYCDIPVIGGTSLRGEYVWGKMPGTLASNSLYAPTAFPAELMERNVAGWYVELVQNIGKLFQAVVRYDVFDPNTDADGSDILLVHSSGTAESNPFIPGGLSYAQSTADLKFSTLGLGLNYYWDEHLRFTAYYDIVKNEKTNPANADTLFQGNNGQAALSNPLAQYRGDLKDNVFTLRAQLKF